MHHQAREFVSTMAHSLEGHYSSVLEFGSYNVNGTARDFVPAKEWYGIDIKAGPGVDEVANAATFTSDRHFDMILSMECLEHAPEAAEICLNAGKLLRDGGYFIITCAGPGRTPHGADGSPSPHEGEFYRNVSPGDLKEWLEAAGFPNVLVISRGELEDDVYALAVK